MDEEYDKAALGFLVYEFNLNESSKTDIKIKRKLKRDKLGDFDPGRINLLRELKNSIKSEINKITKSKYYTHSHGQYSDINDFNSEKMAKDYLKEYPSISYDVILNFIEFSIYVHYLR